MNINEIIKAPILTEKTHEQMSENVYTFKVDRRTNKSEVKKAVEHIFAVKVEKVNIFNVPKKPKKLGRFHGFTNAYKKAIVTLAEGSINFYPEDTQEQKEAKLKAEQETKAKESTLKEKAKKIEEKVAQKLGIKAKASEQEAKSEKTTASKPKKATKGE
ncbi:50S ribosomal protein L23 [Mycoplasma sp. 1654_15]|uniref:50S ribosomal protein L23 n=1 Tax=Mycoplasma sp. 1654_15 TaxID=2725994 RepID=UPI00144956F1|nr:50S ribosomal protein L23 [Mycoplasma sp. 1654_15]QJB71204.1 50S ribosomal protein L23 [Mycoplasma sp. 1654_15]